MSDGNRRWEARISPGVATLTWCLARLNYVLSAQKARPSLEIHDDQMRGSSQINTNSVMPIWYVGQKIKSKIKYKF